MDRKNEFQKRLNDGNSKEIQQLGNQLDEMSVHSSKLMYNSNENQGYESYSDTSEINKWY